MKTLFKTITMLSLSLLLFNCGSDDGNPTDSSNPTVTTISPTNGPKTTIVTINGQDFGTDINKVTVFFNEVEATVQAVIDTKITAQVPARAYTGIVKVVVNGNETEGPIFTYTIIDIQVSTFAGSTIGNADGQGTNAQFSSNLGQIAMDSNGNIFVADAGNHIIRKITPSGIVSTFAGSTQGNVDGQGTSAKFNTPYGLAIDSNDTVFICDSFNYQIRKITPSGVVSTFAGNGSSGYADGQGVAAQFRIPTGIAVDLQNNLYVADYGNNRIRKITPNGLVSTFAGSGTNGSQDGQGINAEFTAPIGIAVDLQNNIYIGDEGIRKITPSGLVTTLAGGTAGNADGQGANAQFSSPTGLAVDKNGIIYVADYNNHSIRKITPNGLVSTFVGGTQGFTNGQGANAEFYRPYSVLIDDNYDVYVADRSNFKIRKITQE